MKRQRGQAAIELALGLIVMVTILLFGIHFAEMGFLGAKVHEAAASTLWDSTAYQTHQVAGWYDSQKVAVVSAQGMSPRYGDFDGRASHNLLGSSPQLAMTQTKQIAVQCQKAGAYAMSALSPFGEPGGIQCSAQADVSVVNIGTNFLNDTAGFFKEAQVHRKTTTLCATGRLTAGTCGTLPMMLGDDALHDGVEGQNCPLTGADSATCAGDTHFYDVVHTVFNNSAMMGGLSNGYTGYPEAWTDAIVPDSVPGGGITGFYMSFQGEDGTNGPFNEKVSDGALWQTSPMDAPLTSGTVYRGAYNGRRGCQTANGYCWLGVFACN